ncbi:unnamed protein product [Bursaphelenchus okinawaensis]|uniref:Uncharacterized protein n=1 Tax=Bursaphelenchus okinawaensis TaxID=465554 RepID=A0A811L6Z6_9BILA|nr:unnamed protein product [Bursaphelenchus okinawaensis]CAG9116996.1 unnamed protein product [Bursaphelenchus okinawaensis]
MQIIPIHTALSRSNTNLVKGPTVLNKTCLYYYAFYITVLNQTRYRRFHPQAVKTSKDVYRLLLTSQRVLKSCFTPESEPFSCIICDERVLFHGEEVTIYTTSQTQVMVVVKALIPAQPSLEVNILSSLKQKCLQRYLVKMVYRAKKLNVKLCVDRNNVCRVVRQVLTDLNMQLTYAGDDEKNQYKFYGTSVQNPALERPTIHWGQQLWRGKKFYLFDHVYHAFFRPPGCAVQEGYLAELFDHAFDEMYLHCINFLTLYQYLSLSPNAKETEFYCDVKFMDMFDDSTFEYYRTILVDFARVENSGRDTEFINDLRGLSQHRNFDISNTRWTYGTEDDIIQLTVFCNFDDIVLQRLRQPIMFEE